MEESAPSPTTPEPPSPIGSEEIDEPGRTRRKTMAATAAQGGATLSQTVTKQGRLSHD